MGAEATGLEIVSAAALTDAGKERLSPSAMTAVAARVRMFKLSGRFTMLASDASAPT
jgi:hypothetical protein